MRKYKSNAEFMNKYFINITETLNLKSLTNSNWYDIMELIR